jgi:hypothetical protein
MTPSSVTWVMAMMFLMVSLHFFGFVSLRRTTGASHDNRTNIFLILSVGRPRSVIRSLALCAGAGPQARCPAQWRPFQGLAAAGELRAGAPPARGRRRRRSADGRYLTAVLSDGLPAVEAACTEALRHGAHSVDVIINILARRRERVAPISIATPRAVSFILLQRSSPVG